MESNLQSKVEIHSLQSINHHQANLLFLPDFLTENEAKNLYKKLTDSSFWVQQEITIFGKTVNEPRLTAWFGDTDATYTYSGITMQPKAWTSDLLHFKKRVETEIGAEFNSVLLNWYRNGHDYMGWHSDDEKELGRNPVIASLSIGAPRSFHFRRKDDHTEKLKFELANGSLLVMQGETQHYWQHQLPKRLRVSEGRINLTFRLIRP